MKKAFLPKGTSSMSFGIIGGTLGELLWTLLAFYLLIINLVTFFVFGLDKWKAKRKAHNEAVRRIPEKTLFLLAGLGGSVGAWCGMRVWHHKTLHKSFRYGIPAILLVQLILIAVIGYFCLR